MSISVIALATALLVYDHITGTNWAAVVVGAGGVYTGQRGLVKAFKG